eukprot:507813_1
MLLFSFQHFCFYLSLFYYNQNKMFVLDNQTIPFLFYNHPIIKLLMFFFCIAVSHVLIPPQFFNGTHFDGEDFTQNDAVEPKLPKSIDIICLIDVSTFSSFFSSAMT